MTRESRTRDELTEQEFLDFLKEKGMEVPGRIEEELAEDELVMEWLAL